MSENIEVCHRDTFRLLSVQMGYVKRHIDLTKTANHELEKDVEYGIMDGLTDGNKLQDIKIMGAIVHTLFQSNISMVAVGICTETKHE